MKAMRVGEALFGAALTALGLFALYKASALPFGRLNEPDAGLFPVSIAVALTIFALLSLAARRPTDSVAAERGGIIRVLVLIVALAAYAWFLPRLGFIVCTAALLVLVLRGLGGVGWLATTLSAAAGTIGCYLLFTRLGMPLPAGVLGF